jgi:hypothetical protein
MMTFEQWQATRRQVDRLQDHVETGGIEFGELERLLWQRWASHEIAARGPKP